MAELNITMKQLNNQGQYDTLYPQTTGENIQGLTFDQVEGSLDAGKITGQIPASQIDDIYTAEQTLSDTTKQAIGLPQGTAGTPDDAFLNTFMIAYGNTTNIISHISDTNNPHNVTASQIGALTSATANNSYLRGQRTLVSKGGSYTFTLNNRYVIFPDERSNYVNTFCPVSFYFNSKMASAAWGLWAITPISSTTGAGSIGDFFLGEVRNRKLSDAETSMIIYRLT